MIPASTGVAHRDLSSPGVTYQQAVRFAERQICLESGSLPGCDGSRAICPNPMGLRRSRLVEHLQVVAASARTGGRISITSSPPPAAPWWAGRPSVAWRTASSRPPGRRRLRKCPPGRRPGSGLEAPGLRAGRWTGRARPPSVGAGKCLTTSAPSPESGSAAPEWPSRPGAIAARLRSSSDRVAAGTRRGPFMPF